MENFNISTGFILTPIIISLNIFIFLIINGNQSFIFGFGLFEIITIGSFSVSEAFNFPRTVKE